MCKFVDIFPKTALKERQNKSIIKGLNYNLSYTCGKVTPILMKFIILSLMK